MNAGIRCRSVSGKKSVMVSGMPGRGFRVIQDSKSPIFLFFTRIKGNCHTFNFYVLLSDGMYTGNGCCKILDLCGDAGRNP